MPTTEHVFELVSHTFKFSDPLCIGWKGLLKITILSTYKEIFPILPISNRYIPAMQMMSQFLEEKKILNRKQR
jgi:hypothetical protein